MTLFLQDPDVTLHQGDALEVLRGLPEESVHCVATSPPFFGLRDYGVEGQIGLEASPDEWAARLVEVFRECRRVLRADGTLWVECGDSYAQAQIRDRRDTGPAEWGRRGGERYAPGTTTPIPERDVPVSVTGNRDTPDYGQKPQGSRSEMGVLKPKDLIGQPFLLAFALRQPYYTGRIKDERDRIWLAAIVDGEGCIHIHRRKAGEKAYSKFRKKDGTEVEYRRKQDTYGVMVSVSNTDRSMIDRCYAITGMGSIHEMPPRGDRKQRQWRWALTGQQSRAVLRELYPHFMGKQRQARIAIACPSSGAEAARYHEAIKDLHNGRETDVDCKPPESLFEPGFYWRGCYTWSKPNGMPESAKDRCTTSHSYVLHFSKSARYFFDGDAISEPAAWERWGDQTVPKHEGTPTAAGWIKPKGKNELLEDMAGGPHRTRAGFNERWDNRVEQNGYPATKNPRSVWTIPTQGFPEAHFATWPEALARRIILAAVPEGGVVLDPFAGSGTTLHVARKLGRRAVGIDLNPEYLEMAARRLAQQSLFAEQT